MVHAVLRTGKRIVYAGRRPQSILKSERCIVVFAFVFGRLFSPREILPPTMMYPFTAADPIAVHHFKSYACELYYNNSVRAHM